MCQPPRGVWDGQLWPTTSRLLKILLDCGYGTAAILATVGAVCRWVVGRGILWVVGLDGVDSAGDSGVAADGKAPWAVLELGREWGGRLGLG